MLKLFLAPAGLLLAITAGDLAAQDFRDLMLVRNRPSPYQSLLSIRGGVLGGLASDADQSIGLENTIGWDGHAYFHQDQFGGREATLDAYAGRYAAYLGAREGSLLGQGSVSRLEVFARYFPFYREGFYQGSNFVPTGRYEGLDWGLGLSMGAELAEDLFVEAGLFYARRLFDRNGATPANYTIPDDHNTYGARLWLEHNTLVLSRETGHPEEGFMLTIGVEREQNDSDRTFGVTGVYQSSLPSGFLRGRGALEWYFPQGDSSTWEISVQGAVADKKDRVNNYDAYRPQGALWFDAELRFRWDLAQALHITPFAKGQFLRILEENGVSSDSKFFFGGGLNAGFDLGDTFSIQAHYSFLTNESREPVSVTKDTFGEHRFFLGLEVRLIAERK